MRKREMTMNDNERLAHSIPFYVAVTTNTKVVQLADRKFADISEMYRQITLNVIKDIDLLDTLVEENDAAEKGVNALRVEPEGMRVKTPFKFDDYLDIRNAAMPYKLNCTELLTIIMKHADDYIKDNEDILEPVNPSHKFRTVEMNRGISAKLVSLIETQAELRNVSVNQQITDILFDRVDPIPKIHTDIFKGEKSKLEFKVRTAEYKKRFIYLDEAKDKLYNYFTDKSFNEVKIYVPMRKIDDEFINTNRPTIEKSIYRAIIKPYRNNEASELIEKVSAANKALATITMCSKEKFDRDITFTIKLTDRELKRYEDNFGGIVSLEAFGYYFIESSKSINLLDASVSKIYRKGGFVEK